MLREFGGGSRDSWRWNPVVGLLWYLGGFHLLVMGSRLQGKEGSFEENPSITAP